MAQFLRPISDDSNSSWVPSSGTDLFAMLDEVTPDDNDIIFNDSGSSATCQLSLTSASTPGPGTRTLKIRASNNISFAVNLNWNLKQGGVSVQSGTISYNSTTYTTKTVEITGSILDYSNLTLELSYGGGQITMRVSWVEFEIPNAVPPGTPILNSAIISDAEKNKITLTYSEALDEASVPSTTDFSLNLSKTVTNVIVSGSTVVLTVNSDYAFGQLPTISYTVGANPIQSAADGTDALAFTDIPIQNNILNPYGITFRSSYQLATNSVYQDIVVEKPTGVVEGDLLVVVIAVGAGDYSVPSPPTGWVAVNEHVTMNGVSQLNFYKIAGASEPANYTFTLNTLARPTVICAAFYNDENNSDWILVTQVKNREASSTTASTGPVTGDGMMVVTATTDDTANVGSTDEVGFELIASPTGGSVAVGTAMFYGFNNFSAKVVTVDWTPTSSEEMLTSALVFNWTPSSVTTTTTSTTSPPVVVRRFFLTT